MTLPNIIFVILDKNKVPYIFYNLNDITTDFPRGSVVYKYVLQETGQLKKQFSLEKEDGV